jgi:hypothetical protein
MAKRKANSAGSKSKKIKSTYRLLQLIIIVISIAVIIYFLGNYHFIRTPYRILVIHKLHFGFQNTYLDLRNWSTLDLFYHTEVEQAIRKTGGQNLLDQIKKSLNHVDE